MKRINKHSDVTIKVLLPVLIELMTETAKTSEAPVNFYQITWRNKPKASSSRLFEAAVNLRKNTPDI